VDDNPKTKLVNFNQFTLFMSEILSCLKTNFHRDVKGALFGNPHNRDFYIDIIVTYVVSLTNPNTHTHTHTHTHPHTHPHTHTYTPTHTHIHTPTHTHTHIRAHTHTQFLSFLLKLQPFKITKL
jgi:hypothetical protein